MRTVRDRLRVADYQHAATQSFIEGRIAPALCSVLNVVWPSMVITSTDLAKACINLATRDEAAVWKEKDGEGVIYNAALRALSAVYE